MNAKRILLMIVGIAICMLTACNWTVGDCYPREEWVKGEGAGGPVGPPVPVFTSVASGDFGAEPPSGPEYGSERKIQCNKTDDEDEDEDESPSDSSERPTASPTSPPDPCQQSGAPTMGCTGKIPIDPRAFNFVTIVAYDGTVSGWQEAKADLYFGHNLEGDAACSVIVGMPIRSERWGLTSPETAAIYAANVANACADFLYENGGRDLPQGIFCERHKSCMRERFPKMYEELGARVK